MEKHHVALLVLSYVLVFGAGMIYSSGSSVSQPATKQVVESPGSATANIVAVAKNRPVGEVGQVNVKLRPGNGDVLVETDPFVKANTQFSAKLAKNVAERYTGRSLENMDVIYEFNISSQMIGGPSAGAAMTLATIAAITGQEVRKDAVITGTVTRNGRIGKVGDVLLKARAAGRAGLESFYVPRGQRYRVNYERVVDTETDGFFVYRDVEYRRRVIDIGNYTQRRFNMETEAVRNIGEAAEKLLE